MVPKGKEEAEAMCRKTTAGARLVPALRWSSLVLALTLVLALVNLDVRRRGRPFRPAVLGSVDVNMPRLGHTFYGTAKTTQGVFTP